MSSLASNQALSPSEAVVRRIAKCEGTDPMELPPLYEAIDPDALDALIANVGGDPSTFKLKFTFHGYKVTITGEGVINVNDEIVVP